jgi:predicted RNA-binding protein with PUA-like domain
MRYEPRCQHKNGYDCEICDKSYEDYKLNYGNQKEKYDDKAFLNEPCWHTNQIHNRSNADYLPRK